MKLLCLTVILLETIRLLGPTCSTTTTWDKVKCFWSAPETCCLEPPNKPQVALQNLKRRLKEEFFGQTIAHETILYALSAHLRDDRPEKPLVLSFHGWAGTGKTFLTRLISQSLYQKKENSEFVVTFQGSLHFPDNSDTEVSKYKKMVQEKIQSVLTLCDRPLFIFDEVDQTPPKLFDALVPFLDQTNAVKGVNQKRAIFIFLSNIGAVPIAEVTVQAWKDGKQREKLKLTDFEGALQGEAFNSPNAGFYRSRLLDRHLVTYLVPFLPLERRHVEECVRAEVSRSHMAQVNPEEILDHLIYWPNDLKLFSVSGCKRVSNMVKFLIEKHRLRDEF